MRESTRQTIAANVAPYLDEGETMRAAAPCFEGPKWAMFFGLIGTMMIKQRLAVVTDRNVYVMRGSYWSVKRPKGVEERHPLGTVTVSTEKGMPVGPLRVGEKTYWVGKVYQGDAEQLARAASGQATS